MRHFMYVSRMKLTSYYEQLKQQPVKKSLKSKLASPIASISTEQEWAALPDLRKISIVETELRARYDIGTLDLPGLWIDDELDVSSVSVGKNQDAMILIGKKEDTYALTIGSASHIIGATVPQWGPQSISLLHSYAPSMLSGLQNAILTL
jgi:hypothetical protein